MSTTEFIVVGVDGTSGSRAAVTYAAREAGRTDALLKIVHVSPDYTSVAGIYPMAYPITASEARAVGHKILAAAAEEARSVIGPDRVRTELITGGRVACLVRAAAGARAIILGDQRRMLVDRLATGTVLGGVAARSSAPVFVVPGDWTPSEHRTLLAAVKACEASSGLIERALRAAADRKARLVLLHVWELPTLYDDMIATRIDERTWEEEARTALTKAVEEVRGDHPDVEVEIRVAHGQPARLIVDASAEADLVLIARRAHAFPLGYLGSTGRTVAREAHSPVVVLPPAGEPEGLAGLAVEREGAAIEDLTEGPKSSAAGKL